MSFLRTNSRAATSSVFGSMALALLLVIGGCGDDSPTTEAAAAAESESEVTPDGAPVGEEATATGDVAPVAVVDELTSLLIGQTTIAAEAGTTVAVEVPLYLVLTDQPQTYAVSAESQEAFLQPTPTEVTVSPDGPETILVEINAPAVVGDTEVVDVALDPVTATDDYANFFSGRIIVESIEVGAPLPPIAVPDVAELAAETQVDVLANDQARQGDLDSASLRLIEVASGQLTLDDITIDEDGLRVTHPGPFNDGAIVAYEVCDTAGVCAASEVWLWIYQGG